MTYIPMRRGFLYLVAIMDWCQCRFKFPQIVCRQNISDIRFGNLREYLAHLV